MAVLASNQRTSNSRLREIMDALLRHLHAFASEVDLSCAELELGLDFLVRIGQATGPEKHEGILLADVLGLATLVGLIDAKKALASGGTEPALIEPFWRANQPIRPNGAHSASADAPGEKLFVQGRVLSLDGKPLANARVETWQASPVGLYENQDPEQKEMNLRARFQTEREALLVSQRPTGRLCRPSTDRVASCLRYSDATSCDRPTCTSSCWPMATRRWQRRSLMADDPNAYRDVVFGAVGSLLQSFEARSDGSYMLNLEFVWSQAQCACRCARCRNPLPLRARAAASVFWMV